AEVEPLVFRELDGTRQVVFGEDKDGRVRYLFLADVPPLAAERREWYETSTLNWIVLGASLAIFASALLFWPAVAFAVRGLSSERIRRTRWSGVWSGLAWLLSLAGLAFAAGTVFILQDPSQIVFGLTAPLKVLL